MPDAVLEKILTERPATKLNEFSFGLSEINTGIVFLYAGWSPTIVQLRNLCLSLEDFQHIRLFIFDIDEQDAVSFFSKNGFHSDGWGETYWVKNGEIVATLKKYDSQNREQLIRNNKLLCE